MILHKFLQNKLWRDKAFAIIFIVITFIFPITSLCMDMPIIDYSRQHRIVLNLSDGDFAIEKWKIFQSIPLHYDYLRREQSSPLVKNMATLYCDVTVPEMKLISAALDKKPGKDFFNHISTLSKKELITLLIAIGKRDAHKQKKAHIPSLIAQMDICLPSETRNIIKSHMERSLWTNCLYNGVVNENIRPVFPKILWRKSPEIMRHTNGAIDYVPACLATKELSCYSGPKQLISSIIEGTRWPTYCSKIITNQLEYRITATTSCGDIIHLPMDPIDNYFVCIMNHATNLVHKTLIKHTEDITDFMFSNTGEYAVSYSPHCVNITTTKAENDKEPYFTNKCLHFSDEVITVCCNNQSTALVISTYDGTNSKIKIYSPLGDHIGALGNLEGRVQQTLFNGDSSRLLTISFHNNTSTVTIWNTSDLSNAYPSFTKISDDNDAFDYATCSPDGDFWSVATQKGTLCLIPKTPNGYMFLALKALIHEKKIEQMIYSPNNTFLITLMSKKEITDSPTIHILNIRTIDYLTTTFAHNKTRGIGITANDKKLVMVQEDVVPIAVPFLRKKDKIMTCALYESTSNLDCAILRRLCLAHNKKDTVELYEEEPACKALLSLPTKPHNLIQFVEKHLPYKMINNNKDILEVGKDMVVIIENWFDNLIKK